MKKKVFITLLSSILVSGCFFGEVGSGYITKTCTKVIDYEDVQVIEEKIVKSKENNIVSIIFNNTIKTEKLNTTFKSIKNSYISELNSLSNLGLKVEKNEDIENTLIVSYEFDLSVINEELKNKYAFEELNHNQIKKYEKEGYECK